MRVFATLPQEGLRKIPAAARAIEAEGYDGVVATENKHDPFLALAVSGAATERFELHTGVAITFARTPMAVANVGWDLAGSTGGRFVVGLGSQVRAHNERRFSAKASGQCSDGCWRTSRANRHEAVSTKERRRLGPRS
jgi:alkanesulfonate monooxygenase SsuD/methylene tetrahydromethanopterin reductase-like flavin-dependent oxidoreductase (luciferase family)